MIQTLPIEPDQGLAVVIAGADTLEQLAAQPLHSGKFPSAGRMDL